MPGPRMAARRTGALVLLCAGLAFGSAAAAAPACPALARLQPDNGWRPADWNMCEPECVIVTVWIGPGHSVRTDKKEIGDAALEARLGWWRRMLPQPMTWVVVDPAADCETIGRITRLIERNRPCEDHYCHYALIPSVTEFHLVEE